MMTQDPVLLVQITMSNQNNLSEKLSSIWARTVEKVRQPYPRSLSQVVIKSSLYNPRVINSGDGLCGSELHSNGPGLLPMLSL
jgi:hypothetical protein